MSKSYLILTDSGGVQEETRSLGKPVLGMKDAKEHPEAVEAGTDKIVGTYVNKNISGTRLLLMNKETYLAMPMAHNAYGDGKAAERIVWTITRCFA